MSAQKDFTDNYTPLPNPLPINLTRPQASQYLKERHGIRRTPGTLGKLATIGGGPKFRKDGRRTLYPVSELDEWANRQLSEVIERSNEL